MGFLRWPHRDFITEEVIASRGRSGEPIYIYDISHQKPAVLGMNLSSLGFEERGHSRVNYRRSVNDNWFMKSVATTMKITKDRQERRVAV
jgi:hypothetical protein